MSSLVKDICCWNYNTCYIVLAQWQEFASQGYAQLLQYTEKAKIPEIIRLYKFPVMVKDRIYDLIKWKYFSSDQSNVRSLYNGLKELEFDAKIEAPHFMQLSYLITSYVQPIFVYFIDDTSFGENSSDSSVTTDLLLLFGPTLLKEVAGRRFNSDEINLSRLFKQSCTNFIVFG